MKKIIMIIIVIKKPLPIDYPPRLVEKMCCMICSHLTNDLNAYFLLSEVILPIDNINISNPQYRYYQWIGVKPTLLTKKCQKCTGCCPNPFTDKR